MLREVHGGDAKSFQRKTVQLDVRTCASKGRKHSVRVVLAPFCAMRHKNRPTYLPVHRNRVETRRMSEKKTTMHSKAAKYEIKIGFEED